ncbi:hypothetical protein D3C73_1544340 [compost metagenome]
MYYMCLITVHLLVIVWQWRTHKEFKQLLVRMVTLILKDLVTHGDLGRCIGTLRHLKIVKHAAIH